MLDPAQALVALADPFGERHNDSFGPAYVDHAPGILVPPDGPVWHPTMDERLVLISECW